MKNIVNNMHLRHSRTPSGSIRIPLELCAIRIWLTVGLVILLVGCSTVPDAINPVEWYKGAKNAIVGQEEVDIAKTDEKPLNKLVTARNKPAPGADEPFPNLGSVPERPNKTSTMERQRIAEGLVSDRESTRQYSKEVIRRQDEPNTTLPLSPKASVMPTNVSRSLTQPASRKTRPIKRPPPRPKVEKRVTQLAKVKIPREPNIKIPAQTLDAPAIASINLGTNPIRSYGPETIIISGKGVETHSTMDPKFVGFPNAGTILSGVRTLEEFNPFQARGSHQVATILFGNGSARLKPRDRRILRQVALQHQKVGGTLRIVGHASSRTGNLEPVRRKVVNFEISVARADVVVRELVRLGAKPGNIFAGAVSDAMPKYKEYMPSGEAGNRRTEVFIDF